jgi:TonB family protein
MKKALILSLTLHLSIFVVLVVISLNSKKKHSLVIPKQVYQVKLTSFVEQVKISKSEDKIVSLNKPEKPQTVKKEIEKLSEKKIELKGKIFEFQKKEIMKIAELETLQFIKPSMEIYLDRIKVDAEEFPFPFYLAQVQSRIKSKWYPPSFVSDNKLFRRSVVYFYIQRNGKVSGVNLENSSGDFLFDQSATRAVLEANPLPELPEDFLDEKLGIYFEFEQSNSKKSD